MIEYTNQELFRKALIEARNQKVDEVLKQVPEDIEPSEKYLAEMERLLSGKYIHKPWRKTKWMIALVAALLALLVGCAVYVYRHKIADFIEGIYDDHAKVVSDEEPIKEGTAVTECYTLTYVPEGYTLIVEDVSFGVSQIWKKSENANITFNQLPMNAINFLDVEKNASNVIEIQKYKIYYRTVDESNFYIWTDGTYVYKLTLSGNIPEDEVIKIIENIQIKT